MRSDVLNLSKVLGVFVLTLADTVPATGSAEPSDPAHVEIFTASDIPVDANSLPHELAAAVEVVEIDGIERLKTTLSRGLPANADAAKRIVMQRISRWDEGKIQRVRQTALGLVKASRYGIQRYPAIVFDSRWVVLGVTDLKQALSHYRRWLRKSQP